MGPGSGRGPPLWAARGSVGPPRSPLLPHQRLRPVSLRWHPGPHAVRRWGSGFPMLEGAGALADLQHFL